MSRDQCEHEPCGGRSIRPCPSDSYDPPRLTMLGSAYELTKGGSTLGTDAMLRRSLANPE